MSSDPSTSGLELRDVTVRYGNVKAVRGVDLNVAGGDVLALLGPSGCGKSTLLRAIAGLQPLAAGTIRWRGRDLASVPVHERAFGVMFQDNALFPHRNVADNIGFGLRMAGLPARKRGDRVAELLDLVGLMGMGDRTIGTLSGGQAQRVALARALAPEPELLLLDEPLGALDRALRDRLVHEIRSIVTSLGLTAIHVTHDQDEAISVADGLALMDMGTVTATGPVEQLLAHPGNAETANALGIDTVWPVRPGADGLALTPVGSVAVPPGTRAILLRPAAVRIAAAGLPALVESCRYRGSDWLITCRLGDGARLVATHDERLQQHAEVALQADLAEAQPLS